MKYCSIDIETTGLDPETCQILSIGAVIEDTDDIKPIDELPKFHGAIKRRNIKGEAYAITMNCDLIGTINHYVTSEDRDEKNDIVQMTGMQFYEEDTIVIAFYYWLIKNGLGEPYHYELGLDQIMKDNPKLISLQQPLRTKPVHITTAGKNFATFDLKFLEKLPRWKQLIKVRQRIMDPSVLYIDLGQDDSLPGMELCKMRANLPVYVAHDAVMDALDVILLFRNKYKSMGPLKSK